VSVWTLWRRAVDGHHVHLTRKTVLYWWPDPRHRHYRLDGSPARFSFARRRPMGAETTCSWVEIGMFELRTVHRGRP
jgi:hypothetical protein